MDHLRALIELAAAEGVPDTIVHAFTDGRDTNPDSGAGYVAEVEGWGGARIASVERPLLRDGPRPPLGAHRSSHTTRSSRDGRSTSAATGEAAVRAAYERGETDEFIVPTLVGEEGRVREGDAVVFFNFRPDRARQLCEKLGPHVDLTTLTEYQEHWSYPVAFPPERPPVTLASFLAERGISQLHVAETEKYAHVTYFFNGGEEDPYHGEERSLVDSPRDVPTYDHKPEMSAREAADVVRRALGGARPRLRDHQLREPRHGRAHGLDPGGGEGVRDGGRVPRPASSRPCTARAGPASSPPTTATPTTCSSRTAARTRPTR